MLACGLIVGLTGAVAGTARGGAEPGITADTILLGGTAPLAGPASDLAASTRGADAFFKFVNANGGVNRRKIVYKVVDDANPGLAARDLVEQDRVFALFNTVGSAASIAVRSTLGPLKIPQLFAATGATTFGRDAAAYPAAIGFQPSYQAEGWVYGKYLARTAAGATVAVLFQNDDDGKDLLSGLRRGLERSRVRIVGAQPYDAASGDVSAQVARLKATGADSVVLFTTPLSTVQAYQAMGKASWRPKRIVVSSASATPVTMEAAAFSQPRLAPGTLSIATVKDPADPARRRDQGLKLYRKIMAQYAPLDDASDPRNVSGMASAWTVVELLTRAGKDPTRASVLKVLGGFSAAGNPFLVPGIVVRTAGKDHFPIEQMLMQRWQKGAWSSFGGLWTYRGA